MPSPFEFHVLPEPRAQSRVALALAYSPIAYAFNNMPALSGMCGAVRRIGKAKLGTVSAKQVLPCYMDKLAQK